MITPAVEIELKPPFLGKFVMAEAMLTRDELGYLDGPLALYRPGVVRPFIMSYMRYQLSVREGRFLSMAEFDQLYDSEREKAKKHAT